MFLTVLVFRVDNGFRMGAFVYTLSVEIRDRHDPSSGFVSILLAFIL